LILFCNLKCTTLLLFLSLSSFKPISTAPFISSSGILFSFNRGTYGTIIHEFGHTLGYMDLYRFAPSKGNPVGFFDIMGSTIGSNPQDFLTYFISEYHGETNWHKPLPIIEKTTKNITAAKDQR